MTKKEAFKDFLNHLYSGNTEIRSIIDKIMLGAEATVTNIPRKATSVKWHSVNGKTTAFSTTKGKPQ